MEKYGLLTLTFDKDEAICAPLKDIKRACETCSYFDDCDWENQDCNSKFIDVINSNAEIRYETADPDRRLKGFYRR